MTSKKNLDLGQEKKRARIETSIYVGHHVRTSDSRNIHKVGTARKTGNADLE